MMEKYKVIGGLVLGDNPEDIKRIEQNYLNKKETKPNKIKYTIQGTCENDDLFNININYTDNGEEKRWESIPVMVEHGKWICELDVIPTSLDYMFVQNIKNICDDDPIRVPKITSITKMCAMYYIKNYDKICYGLDKNLTDEFYEKFINENK